MVSPSFHGHARFEGTAGLFEFGDEGCCRRRREVAFGRKDFGVQSDHGVASDGVVCLVNRFHGPDSSMAGIGMGSAR